jgi:ribonuclease R
VSPIGHFGLALDYYSHFTSPIRRYADLTLHRILKNALACGEKLEYTMGDEQGAPDFSANESITDACEAANDGELRALAAERTIDDIYKAFYMKKHEGEIFEATVISVTSFGFFAMLENTCEGLVPASELGRIINFDESHMSLEDEYGRKFTVGMKLKVCLENADTALGKLTFSLADEDED